jgi:hypothetical protein
VKQRSAASAATLTAYLEGEITASERAAVEAELEGSAEARRTLQQLRNLSELLSAPATELESMDLAARVRASARRRLVASPRRRARRSPLLWLGGLAACLGCVFLFARRPDDASEFHAKANGVTATEGKRWASVQVHRASERGTLEPLGARIAPSDALLISYTNLGASPFEYLMVFAIDSANEVRWLYPAYEVAGENPESIAIQRGRANVALADLVQQDYAAGSLTIYALFTHRPSTVLSIETWLREHGRPVNEPPVAGGALQRIETQVVR